MRAFYFAAMIFLSLTQITKAGLLNDLNSKINSVNSLTNSTNNLKRNTDTLKRNTVGGDTSRSPSNDIKKMNEWKSDIKSAEKAMQKVCNKKIEVEFDANRFKNFLTTRLSPGAFCADAFKVLEYDLCPDKNLKNKVVNKITNVKCLYTSKSDIDPKLKIVGNTLMVGFGENTKEIYEEAGEWFQKELKK